MAKDKKRGFFSWLGLGGSQNDQTEREESDQTAPETALDESENRSEPATESQPEERPNLEGIQEHVAPIVSEISVPEHNATEVEAAAEPHILNPELEQQIDHVEEQLSDDALTQAHDNLALDVADYQQDVADELLPEEPKVETADRTEPAQINEPPEQPNESLAAKVVDYQQNVTDELLPEEPQVEIADETEPAQVSEPPEQPNDSLAAEVVDDRQQVVDDLPSDSIDNSAAQESDQSAALMAEDDLADAIEDESAVQEQERPTKEGFFARLKRSLLRTKQNLGSGFLGLFRNRKIDDELFEELEEQLLIADVGVNTTRKIIDSLVQHVDRKKLNDAEALYDELKSEMSAILDNVSAPLDVNAHKPFVMLMIGVNGVGKTTTIGKLARQFQQQGKSVMLAAGDTFRAAAVEQLQVWGERNKIPVIAQHTGADSASVIFDALQAAKARNVDVLIADTAGRLQNKSNLMEELKKIVRVMKKIDPDAPHEIMLTIDASTGQNAVSQAKLFNEAVGLTGITLTKLDGTAKGGVIFAIADQFSIPIRYIGVGESIEDLRPFKSADFIEALFARED